MNKKHIVTASFILFFTLSAVIGLKTILKEKSTVFLGVSVSNFSDIANITVRHIEKNHEKEQSMSAESPIKIGIAPESNTYLMQVIVKQPDTKEIFLNLVVNEGNADIDSSGLTTQKDIIIEADEKTKIKTDWAGRLVTTTSFKDKLCLTFDNKSICHHRAKSQRGHT